MCIVLQVCFLTKFRIYIVFHRFCFPFYFRVKFFSMENNKYNKKALRGTIYADVIYIFKIGLVLEIVRLKP